MREHYYGIKVEGHENEKLLAKLLGARFDSLLYQVTMISRGAN